MCPTCRSSIKQEELRPAVALREAVAAYKALLLPLQHQLFHARAASPEAAARPAAPACASGRKRASPRSQARAQRRRLTHEARPLAGGAAIVIEDDDAEEEDDQETPTQARTAGQPPRCAREGRRGRGSNRSSSSGATRVAMAQQGCVGAGRQVDVAEDSCVFALSESGQEEEGEEAEASAACSSQVGVVRAHSGRGAVAWAGCARTAIFKRTRSVESRGVMCTAPRGP